MKPNDGRFDAGALEETERRLRGLSGGISVKPRYGNQLEARVPAGEAPGVLLALRDRGFVHLANIFCVDWIAEGAFELVYNLWSYEQKIHCSLKCRIPRGEPRIASIHSLWPQAQVYEQEIHEFFGVVFEGNPDLGPLFLHNWLDAPPLRKDFDTEEYSRRAYGFLDEEAR